MKTKLIAVLAALCMVMTGCATGNNSTVYVGTGAAKLPIEMVVKATEALKDLGGSKLEVLKEVLDTKPIVEEPVVEPIVEEEVIETTQPLVGSDRHHHTTWASSDKGKSLILCPGDEKVFDECHVGSIDIPFHGYDDGRKCWWNMHEEPAGDIECTLDGVLYTFKSDQDINYGNCR